MSVGQGSLDRGPRRRWPVVLSLLLGAILVAIIILIVRVRAPITADRELDDPNPTSWVFGASSGNVLRCAESSLDDVTLDPWGGRASINTLRTEQMRNAPGVSVVVVESEGLGHGVQSERYLHHDCPLPLYATWNVIVEPISEQRSRVTVETPFSSVHNYHCIYIAHPWGCAVDVEPSTVEEYRLLVRLGECLDAPEMPPVRVPQGQRPDPNACR